VCRRHTATLLQALFAFNPARINDHNIQKLDQLLPWNWKTTSAKLAA
jgi:hypothetical protein